MNRRSFVKMFSGSAVGLAAGAVALPVAKALTAPADFGAEMVAEKAAMARLLSSMSFVDPVTELREGEKIAFENRRVGFGARFRVVRPGTNWNSPYPQNKCSIKKIS